MSATDRKSVWLGVLASAVWAAIEALARLPQLAAWVVGTAVSALIFAVVAIVTLRIGPGLLRETPLVFRRMVLSAFIIAVTVEALDQALSGLPVLRWLALFCGAAAGLLFVLRRTRHGISHTAAM